MLSLRTVASWLLLVFGLFGCVSPTAVYLLNRSPVPVTVRLFHPGGRRPFHALAAGPLGHTPGFYAYHRMKDSLQVTTARDTASFEVPAGWACFLDYTNNAFSREPMTLRVYKNGQRYAVWSSTEHMTRKTDIFGKSTVVLAVD